MISANKLCLTIDNKLLLDDFSLTLPERGLICFSGPSGCGKTTLLRVLAGLLAPDSGTVRGLENRRIALLFQEDRLLPWLSAAANVAMALPTLEDSTAAALPWLELVELTEEAATFPADLSGGMRRRLAWARALAYQGEALFLDEPTNGLDEELARRIMGRVRELYRDKLTLLVTHDREFAAEFADTLISLDGPPLRVI